MPTKQKKKLSVDKIKIADRLKKAREALNLTQQQVADKAHVSRSAIVHYERGIVIPGGPELIGLAYALNMTPNFILGGSESFFPSSAPEHVLVTGDEATRMAKIAICMSDLDQDIAESISALAMAALKATLSPDRYAMAMAGIAHVSAVMPAMLQGVESLADQVIKDAGLDQPTGKPRKAKSKKATSKK